MLRTLLALSLLCASSYCLAIQPNDSQVCLSGQIQGPHGVGLAGVALTAKQLHGTSTYAAVSGPNGSFHICGMQQGRYSIAAHRRDFEASIQVDTLNSDRDSSLTIRLAPTQTDARENGLSADRASGAALSPLPANSANTLPVSSGTLHDRSYVGNGNVFEFRTVGEVTQDQSIPNAPLPSKRNLPHGKLEGLVGSMMVGPQDVTMRGQLPIYDFSGAIGGTINSGGTAYFLSFDRFGINRQQLQSILSSLRSQPGGGFLPMADNPVSSSSFVARLDHKFGGRDSSYLRMSRDAWRSYSLRPGKEGKNAGLTPELSLTQRSIAAGNTVAISPETINETTAQFIATDTGLPAGVSAEGVQSGLPTMRKDRVFEAADNIYRQLGKQSLTMGGNFIYNQMNISFLESSLGRVSTGNSSFGQSDKSEGLYVLSRRQLRPNFLLTSGIRYDIQSLRGFKRDTNNLAPQVGFAWGVTPRTVIRGGAGIYYDQIPLPAIAGPAQSGMSANIDNSGRFVSRNGRTAQQLASFTTMSPTIQDSYAERANAQVEQQIGARTEISAETQYVRGVQLALPTFRLASLCVSNSPCNAGNSFSGQEIGTGAVSTYTGTSVAFSQQPTHWGSYKATYTYADLQGSGTGANSSFIQDRMRRASFTGVLHTSQDPGATAWQDLAHGFMLTGTGDYTSRTEFVGFKFFNLNARMSKTLAWGQHYRLSALAETFNAFQRTSARLARSAALMGSDYRSVYSTYRRVAALQSPNATQFGLRLTF